MPEREEQRVAKLEEMTDSFDPTTIKRKMYSFLKNGDRKQFLFFVFLYLQKNKTIDFVDPSELTFIEEKERKLLLGRLKYSKFKRLTFLFFANKFYPGLTGVALLIVLLCIYRKLKAIR